MEKDLFLPGSSAAAGRVSCVGTYGAVLTEGGILVVAECLSVCEKIH